MTLGQCKIFRSDFILALGRMNGKFVFHWKSELGLRLGLVLGVGFLEDGAKNQCYGHIQMASLAIGRLNLSLSDLILALGKMHGKFVLQFKS